MFKRDIEKRIRLTMVQRCWDNDSFRHRPGSTHHQPWRHCFHEQAEGSFEAPFESVQVICTNPRQFVEQAALGGQNPVSGTRGRFINHGSRLPKSCSFFLRVGWVREFFGFCLDPFWHHMRAAWLKSACSASGVAPAPCNRALGGP